MKEEIDIKFSIDNGKIIIDEPTPIKQQIINNISIIKFLKDGKYYSGNALEYGSLINIINYIDNNKTIGLERIFYEGD